MLWMRQFLRKRVLLLVGLIAGVCYLLGQFSYLLLLNEESLTNLVRRTSMGHRQNVAINKIISKWNDTQHSKLVRDKEGHSVSLRGTHSRDISKYLPNANGKFVCIASKEEIDFLKINDDYCDCPLDGSDEPGTNACNNGTFYCELSSKNSPGIFKCFNLFCCEINYFLNLRSSHYLIQIKFLFQIKLHPIK